MTESEARRIRREISIEIETKLRPLIDKGKYDGGYDCCGCSTYDSIVDDAKRVALGLEPEGWS